MGQSKLLYLGLAPSLTFLQVTVREQLTCVWGPGDSCGFGRRAVPGSGDLGACSTSCHGSP